MKRIFVMLIIGFLSAPVFAHKLNVFAITDGDKVNVEGYFSDGIPARNAKVIVTDSDGNVVNEGLADEKGRYQFSNSSKAALFIKINAGMGHVASYQMDNNATSASLNSEPTLQGSVQQPAGFNQEELRQIVSAAVQPLAKEISELKQKSRTSDIVGGIGYILGILGLFAYLKYRKELKGSQ